MILVSMERQEKLSLALLILLVAQHAETTHYSGYEKIAVRHFLKFRRKESHKDVVVPIFISFY